MFDVQNIFVQYWKPALSAFVLAILLVIVALKVFPRLKLMDKPQKYGLNRAPVPYSGGVMIFLAFLVCVLIFVPLSKALTGLVIGATVIVVLGFLDDYFCLSPWIRLLVQFFAAMILIFSGVGILSMNFPFLGVIDFTGIVWGGVFVLSALFTVFWVMLVLNTMNFADGVSGISSGVSFVAALTIFILSIHPGVHENPVSQVPVATIAIIVAMISLAFLIFDFPKAKILMGDSGSTFFGFMLATLAIFSGGKVATAFLVLGLPILDMIWVIARRVLAGQKPWKGDLKHLHHRFLGVGFSERKVVVLYLLITGVMGVTAVSFVSGQQKFFVLIGLLIFVVLLAISLIFTSKKEKKDC